MGIHSTLGKLKKKKNVYRLYYSLDFNVLSVNWYNVLSVWEVLRKYFLCRDDSELIFHC